MMPSAPSRAHECAGEERTFASLIRERDRVEICSDAQNLNTNSRLIFFKGQCLGYLAVSARFLSGNAASCKFPLRTLPLPLIGR